jgi:hypothetical protein
MGAYENPITVIDTESAKIWSNAIANMSNITSQSLKTIQDRRTKEAEKQEKESLLVLDNAMKNNTALLDRMSKAGIKSEAFFKYGMGMMDEVSKIQGELRFFQPSTDADFAYQKDLMKQLSDKQMAIQQLYSVGGAMQTDISAYLNDMGFSPDSKAADPGTPGGMATIGNEETIQYHKVMKALSGVTGGLESMRVENGMLFGRVTGIDEELNLTSILHYDPGTIIDTKKIAQESIDNSGIFGKGNIPINTYLDKSKATTTLTEDGQSSYSIVPYKQKLLFNDIMKNISASGEAILANTKDSNSINAWWMNNAGKDNDFKLNFVTTQDGGKVLDDESKQKWLAKYEEQAKSLIPNYTVVTEENAKELGMEIGTEFIDTQAAETGLSKVTKPKTPKTPDWKTQGDNNALSFINDPAGYANKNIEKELIAEPATFNPSTNILTLSFATEKEGDPAIIEAYNMNDPNDVVNFEKTYGNKGQSQNDKNYRAQFETTYIDLLKRKKELNKNNNSENKEKTNEQTRSEVIKSILNKKAQNKYTKVKQSSGTAAAGLSHLTNERENEAFVTDDEGKYYVQTKDGTKALGLTSKEISDAQRNYQDDVGKDLKNKLESSGKYRIRFKEFLRTLPLEQAVKGKNAENIRAYLESIEPIKTIDELLDGKSYTNEKEMLKVLKEQGYALGEKGKLKKINLERQTPGDAG